MIVKAVNLVQWNIQETLHDFYFTVSKRKMCYDDQKEIKAFFFLQIFTFQQGNC